MKHILTLGLFLLFSLKLMAQTDGITYQAVIIGPDVLELPGVDSEGNYLPVTDVAIRFTIFDSGNQVEFQEIQTTTTDEFGRVNLIIGAVEHDYFETISWDGTSKDLKVEIDFEGGSNFVDMSREQLTFAPYAYHRNITATGTLDVDDDTFLNRELTVNGPTTLNSTLLIDGGNEANLTGDLTVDGTTNLNGSLDVNNQSNTNLTGALNVGVPGAIDVNAPTTLNGTLDVLGKTTVSDFEATGQASFADLEATNLVVNQSTNLFGTLEVESTQQIVLRSTVHTAAITYANNADGVPQAQNDPGRSMGNYPLLVEGSTQGIAIKVNGSRRNGNNFVSFWDGLGQWGRIEGEIPSEYENNADYLFDQSSLDYDIYDAYLDYGFALANEIIAGAQLIKASSDFRACVGLGGCLASPGPADIAFAGVELISATAQAVFQAFAIGRAEDNQTRYDSNKDFYQGVTYASGAGDYAEYLQRADKNETVTYGDIVGVIGGKISKNTQNAERVMVVSFKPIVLGNMPPANREDDFEKVAFMGQVPVKVFGNVNIGDYILPSGKNDGIGVAVSSLKIKSEDIANIVGVAWEKSSKTFGFNLVNVAVGLNKNDNNSIVIQLEQKVKEQAEEINELKSQIDEIHNILSNLKQGKSFSNQNLDELVINNFDGRDYEVVDTDHGKIVYWEVTKDDFEKGLAMAQEQMSANGVDVENHVLWKKINEDPAFKNMLFNKIKTRLDRQLHYHKKIELKEKH
ncbi:hypothetical protein WJN01_12140 [Flavobacteriaceae bacterium SZ-1-7]|uniref:hypothetical protein n=1 Tax=Tamlana sedimenti TaxID=3134126 RepID=UPI0031245A22